MKEKFLHVMQRGYNMNIICTACDQKCMFCKIGGIDFSV